MRPPPPHPGRSRRACPAGRRTGRRRASRSATARPTWATLRLWVSRLCTSRPDPPGLITWVTPPRRVKNGELMIRSRSARNGLAARSSCAGPPKSRARGSASYTPATLAQSLLGSATMASMSVRTERNGPVTTVILSRPDVRNAVDGPTAAALAEAFRSFQSDAGAAAAVLWGEGGTFCAGADLTAVGTTRGNGSIRPATAPWAPPACD